VPWLSLDFQVLYAGCSALAKVTELPCLVAGRRIGKVWHHGLRTVRRHPRSPHISMAITSVTVQLCI